MTGRFVLALLVLLALVAPARDAAAEEALFGSAAGTARRLVIESSTDIEVIGPLLEAFAARNPDIGILYRELETMDLYRRAETACHGGRRAADIVFSSAMDLQVRLVNDGCARPVSDPALDALPEFARWRGELFGLTFEPAVIVYNRRLVGPLEAPADHFDLLDLLRQSDRFTGLIGTYDIETSGLGYLYATLDAQQSSTFGRLIEAMGRSAVRLFCCTSDILERVADGRLAIGYNVLGSYAFAEAERNPHLAIVLPSDYTLVLTRAAFVPKSAANPADAARFLAFSQSPAGRAILDSRARLFSPLDGARAVFRQAGIAADARQSLRPVALSPSLLVGIDRMKRDLFLRQWRISLGRAGG